MPMISKVLIVVGKHLEPVFKCVTRLFRLSRWLEYLFQMNSDKDGEKFGRNPIDGWRRVVFGLSEKRAHGSKDGLFKD